MEEKDKKKIVIFASGSGSNTDNIIRYFSKKDSVKVALIFTNNPSAGVIDVALKNRVRVCVFSRNELRKGLIEDFLTRVDPDLIVLAGFLWLLPPSVIRAFPKKIINIHPALLPQYGGKGMYGKYVHEAVAKSGDKESGVTIHFVTEQYDEGPAIAQFTCSLKGGDNAAVIEKKVRQLELEHYPKVIEQVLLSQ